MKDEKDTGVTKEDIVSAEEQARIDIYLALINAGRPK